MGLNLGSNLFEQRNTYSNEGKLQMETEAEDAGRTKTLILKHASPGGGLNVNATIYTVPANKVLFITSAMLSGIETGAGADGFFRLYIDSTANNILEYYVGTDNIITNMALSFPHPIKVAAASAIIVAIQGTGRPHAGFIGWLEDA